eukprot:NODE_738_length_4687_cov_0.308849.p11 type:complete len:101 gc:universal NODE_738_length_4687_cov_0.308849:4246-4548(+)
MKTGVVIVYIKKYKNPRIYILKNTIYLKNCPFLIYLWCIANKRDSFELPNIVFKYHHVVRVHVYLTVLAQTGSLGEARQPYTRELALHLGELRVAAVAIT